MITDPRGDLPHDAIPLATIVPHETRRDHPSLAEAWQLACRDIRRELRILLRNMLAAMFGVICVLLIVACVDRLEGGGQGQVGHTLHTCPDPLPPLVSPDMGTEAE